MSVDQVSTGVENKGFEYVSELTKVSVDQVSTGVENLKAEKPAVSAYKCLSIRLVPASKTPLGDILSSTSEVSVDQVSTGVENEELGFHDVVKIACLSIRLVPASKTETLPPEKLKA